MAFRIGQKVVCIKRGQWIEAHLWVQCPRYGDVLTIRDIETIGGEVFLRFVEIRNKPRRWIDYYGETSFFAERFRPVTEKQTDITCFTEILDRENKNCRVPVSDHQSN